jgi:hypothetical protein
MKNKKLYSNFKKRLLLLIIIEILAIIYLLNAVLSSQPINFQPVFVDMPMKVLYVNNTNSTLKYFRTITPNGYYIDTSTTFSGPTVYSFNSDGLRDRYNYSRDKPSNVFRIAIFGDSFTFGLYLNITDVFTEILEDRLNSLNCSKKIEVLNFGVGGYDISYMIELFKQKGKYYNSDINIFMIKDDDIYLVNEIWMPINEKYMKNVVYPENSNDNISYSKFIEAAQKASDEYGSATKSFNFTHNLEDQVKTLYNENAEKSKIILFTYLIKDSYNELLRNFSKDYRFIFLSLNNLGNNYDKIWQEKFSAIPFKDQHPNKLGHQFLSDFLYVYLVSNNLINC